MKKNNSIVLLSLVICFAFLNSPRDGNAQSVENPKHDFALTGLKVSFDSDSDDTCDFIIEVQVYVNGTNDWELDSNAGYVALYYSTDEQNWQHISNLPIIRDEMDTPWIKGKVWPNDFVSDPVNGQRWWPWRPDDYVIKGEIKLYNTTDENPGNNTNTYGWVGVQCSNMTAFKPPHDVLAEWAQKAIEDGYIKFDFCRKYPWLCPVIDLHDLFPLICTKKGSIEVFWDDRIGGLDILIAGESGKIVSEPAQLKAPVMIDGKQYNRRLVFNKVIGEKYKVVYWCIKEFKPRDLSPLPIHVQLIEKK